MSIMSGDVIADNIKKMMKEKIQLLSKPPGLAVILVGNDAASRLYVSKKEKTCKEIGIYIEKYYLEHADEGDILRLIDELNKKDDIDGILVQLPLPEHINTRNIVGKMDPSKDVDGFHPINIGRLDVGDETLVPCTARGIIKLLDSYDVKIKGKHAVIIGRSNIVGKPVAKLLLNRDATVTICHSKTENLYDITKMADILVCAVGLPGIVTKDMVKNGTVVIDVGINRINGRIVGDVDSDAKDNASYITPVPGGVGPMTVAMLLENLMTCYSIQRIKSKK